MGRLPGDVSTFSKYPEDVFRDRINSADEQELVGACHRMNCEIISCTHSIIADWSEARKTQTALAAHANERIFPKDGVDVAKYICNAMLNHIQEARCSPLLSDNASTVELALRAWTVHCVTMRMLVSTIKVFQLSVEFGSRRLTHCAKMEWTDSGGQRSCDRRRRYQPAGGFARNFRTTC